MNTEKYMPFSSVYPIISINSQNPEYPYFSGTGFFVKFPPYQDAYFITAKHCLHYCDKSKQYNFIKVLVNKKEVFFSNIIHTTLEHDDLDLAICIPDSSKNLTEVCLELLNQEDVETIFQRQIKLKNQKLRVIGFPSCSKVLDYGDHEAQGKIQARGFNGFLRTTEQSPVIYKINETNWPKNSNTTDFYGFSGAPVLELLLKNGTYRPYPMGVVITGSNNIVHFININYITDLIANYINKNIAPKLSLNANSATKP